MKSKPRRLLDHIVAATNSFEELLFVYATMILTSGAGFSYFEHKHLDDGLWWAIVTSTTTGYGDLSPVTWQGRVIAALLMLASILFVLPLMIGYIASHLIKNKNEFTHEEQEEFMRLLRKVANEEQPPD